MKHIQANKLISVAISNYCKLIKNSCYLRSKILPAKNSNRILFDVVNAFMGHQLNLAINFAASPSMWTRFIAPMILRNQIDAYISLAWIISKKTESEKITRAKEFIEYGLGQEKLFIEHLKNKSQSITGKASEEIQHHIEQATGWLNAQQWEFLTDVNVGSWSGSNTRTMALETNNTDLYNYHYTRLSWACHNTWNYIAKHGLKTCNNPLHKKHLCPEIDENIAPSLLYLQQSADLLSKLFILVDLTFKLYCNIPNINSYLENKISKVHVTVEKK